MSGEQPSTVTLPSAKRCVSRRAFAIRLTKGMRVKRATVTVAGKRVAARKRNGRWTATVDLRGKKAGRYVVRIRAVTTKGRIVTAQRAYRTCARR